MTTTRQLRGLAIEALTGTTDAGQRVYSPRDQASWDGEYPVLFVYINDENGASFGPNGAPAFTVTSTLLVEGRASHAAEPNDAGAGELIGELEDLRDQIKAAVVNYPSLMMQLNQFSFFRTRMVSGPDEAGEHLGAVTVELGLEFVQGPEDFYPVVSDPLERVDIQIKEPDGTSTPGLTIDFPQ